MQLGQPSKTALGAAGLRAAHQTLDRGVIFSDPLALRILGSDADALLRNLENDPARKKLRWFIAVRSRVAEDALAQAAGDGAAQLVVLGAGLDTYAYRTTPAATLRIFEVDHPETQAWKRQRLAEAAIPVPDHVRYVPVDFERDTLADCLTASGFDRTKRTFFTWLGVVPYLTESAILATLGYIAALPGGADVVFDYVNPPETMVDPARRAAHDALAQRVAAIGETIKGYFDTDDLCAKLSGLGFRDVRDLDPAGIAARFFSDRSISMRGKGAHIMHASTVAQVRTAPD
ncbi:MAG: class I SAM-dependent methyltransferase [Rhodopseudomonas sp.]|uniref:class I SAM-dependent methyltransferase n=1 Tax=Rhodopseudomonas sp. TaxID=1078 RepID=UPI0017945278|nr:SAM-dependent methyltransferase [Rhodopseudomonas sp.]NVN85120.1 class I SAM-dependent methyltransferase [Rhodopseudomonas sp.]